jgi:2-dehydro-3-deoxygluconokinase
MKQQLVFELFCEYISLLPQAHTKSLISLPTGKMKKIFCFGELLIRLSPSVNGEWIRQSSIHSFLGGAELNVAHALARWNQAVSYCSALPENWLSSEILQELKKEKIDVSGISMMGNRIGTYYLPDGADLKNVAVIYDRAHSSFTELRTGMLDWNKLLDGIDWFHFSAITPAIDLELARLCEEGLKAASSRGITVSLDLNYRSKLWQFGKKPLEVMPALAEYCDLIMGNIWSAEKLLGVPLNNKLIEHKKKEAYLDHAEATAKAMQEKFKRAKWIANTFRFDTHNEIEYYGTLHAEGNQFASSVFTVRDPLDRVGTGDCFMAGLIYGLCNFRDPGKTVEFASSAASGKFFEKGDFTKQYVEEVLRRMQSPRIS